MKFVLLKCVAFAVAWVGQLAAADSGINLSGAVSAALGDGKENVSPYSRHFSVKIPFAPNVLPS